MALAEELEFYEDVIGLGCSVVRCLNKPEFITVAHQISRSNV